MKVMTKVVALVPVLFCAVGVQAQSFNIDLGVTANPTPAATYGAASGQLGTWNNVTLATAANQVLNSLAGVPTAATISLNGGTMLNLTASAPNGLATPAGSQGEFLLDDLWDPGANVGGIAGTITINNLAAGAYTIYTYGVAPDSGTASTGVTVVGAVEGPQNISGVLPNPFNDAYALGLTHSIHNINLAAAGNVTINIGVTLTFASVSGLQIIAVPAPGALAMLGLAGLVGSRRRRS